MRGHTPTSILAAPHGADSHLCAAPDTRPRIACDDRTRDDIRLHSLRHLSAARAALLRWQHVHGACTRTGALLRASASVAFPAFDAACH